MKAINVSDIALGACNVSVCEGQAGSTHAAFTFTLAGLRSRHRQHYVDIRCPLRVSRSTLPSGDRHDPNNCFQESEGGEVFVELRGPAAFGEVGRRFDGVVTRPLAAGVRGFLIGATGSAAGVHMSGRLISRAS